MGEPVGKIALWRTVIAAYRFTFEDPGRFFRVSVIWLCLTLIETELPWLDIAILAPRLKAVPATVIVALGILNMALIAATAAGYIAFPVAWHRAILLDEAASGWRTLRFGRRELRFLGNSFLIGLIVTVPAIPLIWALMPVLAADDHTTFPWMGVLRVLSAVDLSSPSWREILVGMSAIGVLAALIATPRLSLALPAVAVEEPGEALDQAWRRGKKNTLRLAFGVLLCAAPFQAIGMALNVALAMELHVGEASGLTIVYAVAVVSRVVDFFAIAVGVGFLSYSYRQLRGFSPTAPAPAAVPV